jgi:hypothetical protein
LPLIGSWCTVRCGLDMVCVPPVVHMQWTFGPKGADAQVVWPWLMSRAQGHHL